MNRQSVDSIQWSNDDATGMSYIVDMAKCGLWNPVLFFCRHDPNSTAKACRYKAKSNGWTLLHYASYSGNMEAMKLLMQFGSNPLLLSSNNMSSMDIAKQRKKSDAVLFLERYTMKSVWIPHDDPQVRPSSCHWAEAIPKICSQPFLVGYAGKKVKVKQGDRYYVDSLGRTLVGWHGTYSPPLGMADESMVRLNRRR